MGDETSTDLVADEGFQVGRDGVHLVREIVVQLVAELAQAHDATRKVAHVDHVVLGDVGAHRGVGGVDHLLGLVLVAEQLSNGRLLVSVERGLREREREREREKSKNKGAKDACSGGSDIREPE